MFKVCAFIALLLTSTLVVLGQSGDAPKVSISGLGWRVAVMKSPVVDRVWQPKTGLPGDSGTIERGPQMRTWTQFFYSASLANDSGRKIRGVVWEYSFADLNGTLLKTHTFYWPRPVKSGKKRVIAATNQFGPTPVVDAKSVEKNGEKYVETVGIRCIVFEREDYWKRADVPESECERLRKDIKDFEQRISN